MEDAMKAAPGRPSGEPWLHALLEERCRASDEASPRSASGGASWSWREVLQALGPKEAAAAAQVDQSGAPGDPEGAAGAPASQNRRPQLAVGSVLGDFHSPAGPQRSRCSYLLQGPPDADNHRSSCSSVCLSEPVGHAGLAAGFAGEMTLGELLEDVAQPCAQCSQALARHRASYMCRGRRALLTFGGHTRPSVSCKSCEMSWALPEAILTAVPAVAFLNLLWSAEAPLPCGHDFLHGVWALHAARFAIRTVEMLTLELRGPTLRPAATAFSASSHELMSRCLAVAAKAERMLEAQMRRLLSDFRMLVSESRGQGWVRSRWARQRDCGRHCRRLLDALALVRKCINVSDRMHSEGGTGTHHRLADIGIACRFSLCLAQCKNLACSNLYEPRCNKLSAAHEKDSRTRRAVSAPPRVTFTESSEKPMQGARLSQVGLSFAGDGVLSLDDLSLGPLLHSTLKFWSRTALGIEQSWGTPEPSPPPSPDSSLAATPKVKPAAAPAPPAATPKKAMDEQRSKLKICRSGSHEYTLEKDGAIRLSKGHSLNQKALEDIALQSETSARVSLSEWAELCEEPRAALEASGLSEPYDLAVASGIAGLGVPLPPSSTDDVGAVIAHALLSRPFWEQLRDRLKPYCLAGKEAEHCLCSLDGKPSRYKRLDFPGASFVDSPITVDVRGRQGVTWQVMASQPLRFHLLRHKAFGDDAAFCWLLRRCVSKQQTGGKSKASFWQCSSGELVLKEIKKSEATHLGGHGVQPLQGKLAARLAAAADGEPSALCDVFGHFEVKQLSSQGRLRSSQSILIMRNLRHLVGKGPVGGWQLFDIKGVGCHRRAPPAPSSGSQPLLAGREVSLSSQHRGLYSRTNSEDSSMDKSAEAEADVQWDGGFLEAIEGLPLVLPRADHEALMQAIRDDTEVLEDLGVVDYSLLAALARPDARRGGDGDAPGRGVVRIGLIDFLQPYTLDKQLESKVKRLVSSHEPTIVEPAQYRRRFRTFLGVAFEAAPE